MLIVGFAYWEGCHFSNSISMMLIGWKVSSGFNESLSWQLGGSQRNLNKWNEQISHLHTNYNPLNLEDLYFSGVAL